MRYGVGYCSYAIGMFGGLLFLYHNRLLSRVWYRTTGWDVCMVDHACPTDHLVEASGDGGLRCGTPG